MRRWCLICRLAGRYDDGWRYRLICWHLRRVTQHHAPVRERSP